MSKLSFLERRIKRLYRTPPQNIFSHRFYEDLCVGYYTFGEAKNRDDFLCFEPKQCEAERLFRVEYPINLSYEFLRIIENAIRSMIKYGNAYLYLKIDYETVDGDGDPQKKKPIALSINELFGLPSNKKANKTLFYRQNYGGSVDEIILESNQLIVLRITDLGFRNNYFNNMLKRLGKYDITSVSTKFINEGFEAYDFKEHSKKGQINALKTTKDIGWVFRTDDLSDSHILYRKIRQSELKVRMMHYVVEKINEALKQVFKQDRIGTLIIQERNLDFSQLWTDYSTGKITGAELSSILY